MDRVNGIKASAIVVATGIFSYLGILAIPITLMVISNIVDYVTGLGAAKCRGLEIDSNKGFKGIWKKVCMWLLVVAGALIDYLLIYTGEHIGVDIQVKFLIASVVCVWIICNELISILENINDSGVNIPPFLMPIVENLKSKAEKKGGE